MSIARVELSFRAVEMQASSAEGDTARGGPRSSHPEAAELMVKVVATDRELTAETNSHASSRPSAEDAAATRVQAAIRGKAARGLAAGDREEREKRARAATRVQAATRGRSARGKAAK